MSLEKQQFLPVAVTAALALSGCAANEAEYDHPPTPTDAQPSVSHQMRSNQANLPSDVLRVTFSDEGVRIVEFKPKGSTILKNVVELCDGTTLVGTSTRISREKERDMNGNTIYTTKNEIRARDKEACKDGILTPEDKLPLPKFKAKPRHSKAPLTSA